MGAEVMATQAGAVVTQVVQFAGAALVVLGVLGVALYRWTTG